VGGTTERVVYMARGGRVLIEHACYHIVARGNQKQVIFKENDDFDKFLGIVKMAKKKYTIKIYAYCLMPNHVHLLIDPSDSYEISKFMHWINRGYTAYFNTKYEKVGHLWQGRFKSKPIVKDNYLFHCASYIEMNPLRAGLVTDISNYLWTSYNERCLLSDTSRLDDIMLYNILKDTVKVENGDTLKV